MIVALSKREKEVLSYVINGSTNTSIAQELKISIDTVKAHVSSIIRKLEAKNRVDAAVKGVIFLESK